MWQSTTPIRNFDGRSLTGLDAWAWHFSRRWEALELEPNDLSIDGLEGFARAVAEKHGAEDPGVVAARLYPECGEFHDQVYPPFCVAPLPQNTAALPIVDGDVPF